VKSSADERRAAAEYLAGSVTGVKAVDLWHPDDWFVDQRTVNATFEAAIRMHTTCGCEHAVRLTRARDVLLGVTPAAPGEQRLAL
jgi:hypothetical protein